MSNPSGNVRVSRVRGSRRDRLTGLSPRARQVVELFDLSRGQPRDRLVAPTPGVVEPPALEAGEVALVSGGSGAGKSRFLRLWRKHLRRAARCVVDAADIRFPNAMVIDCFPMLSIERALALLARVGLAEAWLYLRTPRQLSVGQRWRLQLAMAVAEGQRRSAGGAWTLLVDEFAAVLDRIATAVVCRTLQALVRSTPGLSAIIASGHRDVEQWLQPDVHVQCAFPAPPVISRRQLQSSPASQDTSPTGADPQRLPVMPGDRD